MKEIGKNPIGFLPISKIGLVPVLQRFGFMPDFIMVLIDRVGLYFLGHFLDTVGNIRKEIFNLPEGEFLSFFEIRRSRGHDSFGKSLEIVFSDGFYCRKQQSDEGFAQYLLGNDVFFLWTKPENSPSLSPILIPSTVNPPSKKLPRGTLVLLMCVAFEAVSGFSGRLTLMKA